MDVDHDLARPGRRIIDLIDDEGLGRTKSPAQNGSHGAAQYPVVVSRVVPVLGMFTV